MKLLRTIYLYDLNEKARKHGREVLAGFSLTTTKQWSNRYWNSTGYLKNGTIKRLFTNIYNIIYNDIKDSQY